MIDVLRMLNMPPFQTYNQLKGTRGSVRGHSCA